jgi:hypothetical protein
MDLNIDVLDGILQFMDKMPNSLIESSHVYAFTQIISESIKIQENNPLDGMEYLSAICKKYGWNKDRFTYVPIDMLKLRQDINSARMFMCING